MPSRSLRRRAHRAVPRPTFRVGARRARRPPAPRARAGAGRRGTGRVAPLEPVRLQGARAPRPRRGLARLRRLLPPGPYISGARGRDIGCYSRRLALRGDRGAARKPDPRGNNLKHAVWRTRAAGLLLAALAVALAATPVLAGSTTSPGRSSERALTEAGEGTFEILEAAEQYAEARTAPADTVDAGAFSGAYAAAKSLPLVGGSWSELTNDEAVRQ